MRVVVGPVVVGDRICRIVSPVATLLEVEEWVGSWWEPSSVPLTLVGTAPLADTSILAERGVPPAEWLVTVDPATRVNIEAMILPHGRDAAAAMELDENVRRSDPPTPRVYPGNVRFGLSRRPDPPDDAAPAPRRPRGRGKPS